MSSLSQAWLLDAVSSAVAVIRSSGLAQPLGELPQASVRATDSVLAVTYHWLAYPTPLHTFQNKSEISPPPKNGTPEHAACGLEMQTPTACHKSPSTTVEQTWQF